MKNFIFSFLCVMIATSSNAQKKKYIKRNKNAVSYSYATNSIYARGMYADSQRLFIGNSDGSIYYLNLEKQKSELIFKLPGLDEIRDIEKSGSHLIGMHSGDNGKLVLLELDGSLTILKKPDWNGVFLDGIDFYNQRGFMMGDPVGGVFSLFDSEDSGLSWRKCKGELSAFKGEAGFAASGTNVQVLNDSTYVFVSGGEISRFFKSTDNGDSWMQLVLPYYPGKSIGPYSICFANNSMGVIVGGDYKDPELSMNTCFYTNDGGLSWLNANKTVRGYRSCVYYTNGVFYACGRNGIDFSLNGGIDWTPFANGTFYSLTSSKGKLIASTKNGTVTFFDLIHPEK